MTDTFISSEVPVHILPDGREFITDVDALECPEVMAFIKRFNNYWRRAQDLSGWVGPGNNT